MSKAYGVGIIGASAARGWAKDSHVPAIQGLRGLELVAVASGSEGGAKAAADAFHLKNTYANGFDLINDPAVEIVTVAVKVPDHRDLILAAVAAGKHVYCEWPLGRNLSESVELERAAQKAGVHTAIGLQMRGSAAVRQAAELIQNGRIGRVLHARVESTTAAFGPEIETAMTFGEDAANGVTLLTVQGAHTFDLTIRVLGELNSFSSLTATQFPRVKWEEDGSEHDRTTPDFVLMQGFFARVPCGISVMGGSNSKVPSSFEVTGTKRMLRLEGTAVRGVQSARLRVLVDGQEETLDEGEAAAMPDAAVNVAGMYTMLRDDIASGRSSVPGFGHAVRLSHLVNDVLDASATGVRKSGGNWPLSP